MGGLCFQKPLDLGIGCPLVVLVAPVGDEMSRRGNDGVGEVLSFGTVVEADEAHGQRATGSDHTIVIVAQRFFDSSRISSFDGLLEDLTWLFPPYSKTVILNRSPPALGDPCDRILMKCSAAFRLAVLVAVAIDDVSDALAALFPGVTDIPIYGVHHHAIDAGLHPEADNLFCLVLPLDAVPVVLRQFDGFAGFVLPRPTSPVVALRALAVSPVL